MENFENNPFEPQEPQESQQLHAAPAQPGESAFAQPKQENRKKRPMLRAALSIVLALALVAGSCAVTYTAINSKWEDKARMDAAAMEQMQQKLDKLQVTPSESLSYVPMEEGAMTPKMIYQNYASSVVAISATVQSVSYGGQTRQGTSTGSGFILTDNGYVVTNYHVIEGATSVKVVMGTEEEYDAEVIGYDSLNDVAVLKIDAENLPAVKLGSSDELCIGDMVVAIGNPLGSLTATLTVGYVSGKDRQVATDSKSVINMIQTDAAINSGNSGGPLFNMYGEVVGITSAKYSGTTSSGASIEGISFAIPIDDVMSIIGDLRDFGYVTGAYLGVTVQDTDSAAASLYGLPTGAYVVTVVEKGSADRAGIQPKDIIIALGEYDVSTVSELTRTLRRFKAGDTTTVTVIRSGERITMDITLDEKPKDLNSTVTLTPTEPGMPENGNYDEWYKYFFGDK